MLIDLHAHHLTKDMYNQHPHWGPFFEQGTLRVGDWRLGTKRESADPLEKNLVERWGTDARLEAMNAAGVDRFVFSLPLHLVMYHTEAEFNIRYAKTVNDSLAEYCTAQPDRWFFWAHAPMQAPEAAAQELERAVTELGAKGLCSGGANFGGLEPYMKEMYPIWEKACELDVPVFVHGYNQSVTWGDKAMDDPFDTTSIVGMNSDETKFFWYIVNGGTLDDFPELKIIITHGGGFVPFQFRRFHETNLTMAPDSRNKKPIAEYKNQFFFDLDIHSPYMRRAIIDEMGVDQVVYGSNFGGADSHHGDLTDGMGLGEEDREQIRSGNALELLNW